MHVKCTKMSSCVDTYDRHISQQMLPNKAACRPIAGLLKEVVAPEGVTYIADGVVHTQVGWSLLQRS